MPYADPVRLAEYKREWARKAYAANPEPYRAKHLRWSKANREQLREGDRLRANRYNRLYPEKLRAKAERYRKANPEKFAARCARRAAAKLLRTPEWANIRRIAQVYRAAATRTRATGRHYEVDHKLPLRGKQVSGLHVHENLRVVLRSTNRRKSNKL